VPNCGDRVEYDVPGSALANRLAVRREVEAIFNYRAGALKKHFALNGK
jgi:hypothetical protein